MFEKASQASGVENAFDSVIGWLTFGMAGLTAFGADGWLNHLWGSLGGPLSAEVAGAAMGNMTPSV